MTSTNTIVKRTTLFLILLLIAAPQILKAQDGAFSELKKKFSEGQIFKVDFTYRTIDSYTEDTTSNTGWIWVGDEEYKVRTDRQSVVVNGKTSMVYDNNRNRVIISKYVPEEDDFAPSRIMNGVDSTFTVDAQEWKEDHYYIKLTSEDPFAIYQQVELFLSKQKEPLKIRAVDPVDNIIITEFNEGRFVPATEEMFHLDYPDGAEIVDMRKKY